MDRWVIEHAAEITKAMFASSVTAEKIYVGCGSEMGTEVGAFFTAVAKAIESADNDDE